MHFKNVMFCAAMLIFVAATSSAADKKDAKDAGKGGSYSGTIVRDGEKLLLRVSKQKAYRLKVADDAPADVKKTLTVDNKELSEKTWTVTGSISEEDNIQIISVKSIKGEPKKKK